MVKELKKQLLPLPQKDLEEHLLQAGVIPESYGHDSTEEKLYAKYCDVIVANAFNHLGIHAQVLEERANAADVSGEVAGKYSIVADAKAFRMSRTARNQKDFKVGALNLWRGDKNYASLVGPLYQYLPSRSQIYSQAISFNVALLSYYHLYFILKNKSEKPPNLEPLWNVASLSSQNIDDDAEKYWKAFDTQMCNCLQIELSLWEKTKKKCLSILPEQAKIEIAFWITQKTRIKALTREQAVAELISALKIDSKIESIKETAGIT